MLYINNISKGRSLCKLTIPQMEEILERWIIHRLQSIFSSYNSYAPLNQSTKIALFYLMNGFLFNLQNNIISSLYPYTCSRSFSVLGTAYLPALLHFQTMLPWQINNIFIIISKFLSFLGMSSLQLQAILLQQKIINTHSRNSILISRHVHNILNQNNLLKRIIHIN